MVADEMTPGEEEALAEALAPLLADPALWEDVPADLEHTVVASIRDEIATARPMPLARAGQGARRGSGWGWRAVAAVAGAVAAATVTVVVMRDGGSTQVAGERVELSPPGGSGAAGAATLRAERSGVRITLAVAGLDRRDGGDFYQLWLKSCDGTALVPAGSFHDLGDAVGWAGVSLADFPLVTVTRESLAGPDDPQQASSGDVVLQGRGRHLPLIGSVSILLALGSALVYGVADYCGGRASRAHPSAVVTVIGQSVSLVLVVALVLLLGTPPAPLADWWWGAAAGAAGAAGLAAFYFALSRGTMAVVAPLTAVVGAVLPVAAGLAQGERPQAVAYAGVAVGVLAVALVSGALGNGRADLALTGPVVLAAAVVAGLGFGTLFVLLDRTSDGSGMWPLVAARLASVPLLLVAVGVGRSRPGRDRRTLRLAVAAGVLDMTANGLYLAAVRDGLLSLVAVVSSLYPASTVALAFALDRERVGRWQVAGLALAALALVLVTLGR